MPDLRKKDVTEMTFSSTRKNPVTDTKQLSGEAQDSLYGKNVTKPDSRNGGKSTFGKLGGQGSP